MKTKTARPLLGVMAVTIVSLVAQACCQADEVVVTTENRTDASIRGSVTYRERIELSPDAKLVVELRDVSYQDATAPLIASKTIEDPGQIPIEFELRYSGEDIEDQNTYAVSATIYEIDGRMAFTNDTAYDVITRGNPDKVDMLLVMVQPPSELTEEGAPDWRSWIEVPATITGAELLAGEYTPTLRVTYLQSTVEGCARRGTESLEVVGRQILVTVTLMEHPETAWSPDCKAEVVELDTIHMIESGLQVGETYQVVVNGDQVMNFAHE